jgi:hypothetical protein
MLKIGTTTQTSRPDPAYNEMVACKGARHERGYSALLALVIALSIDVNFGSTNRYDVEVDVSCRA